MMPTQRRVWCVSSENLILERLSEREVEVLARVAAGLRNQDIADEFRISIKTVEFHLSNIMGKLGARSRTEAVVRAWQAGMLELTEFN